VPRCKGGKAKGVPAKGGKAKGVPAKGGKAKGVPAKGGKAKGVPATGRKAKGMPATGRKAKGMPATGGRPKVGSVACMGSHGLAVACPLLQPTTCAVGGGREGRSRPCDSARIQLAPQVHARALDVVLCNNIRRPMRPWCAMRPWNRN
jgi:hypothetical protein